MTLLAKMREMVELSLNGGDLARAVLLQLEIRKETKSYSDIKLLIKLLILNGDNKGALRLIELVKEKFPKKKDKEMFELKALGLMRSGEHFDALEILIERVRLDPNNARLHDGLSEVFHLMGNEEQSILHGQRSLKSKMENHRGGFKFDVSRIKIPKFNGDDPTKNIISYSLFSENKEDHEGAVENVKAAKTIYPEWTCRFYYDSKIPKTVLRELKKAGAQMILVLHKRKDYSADFWRLKVCHDPKVDRYLIRDATRLLTAPERACVDEWLKSPFHFHGIRDHATHTDLIHADLWGGVKGALPQLHHHYMAFQKKTKSTKPVDQEFLCKKVWPIFEQSCLIHDSRHRLYNTNEFPVGNL